VYDCADNLQRRRKQIRIAQRAYRERKEATISGLSDRVQILEGTIENMRNTFAEFGDIAANSQTSFVTEYRRTKVKLDKLIHDGTYTSLHKEQSTGPSLPNADSSSSQGARIQPSKSNQHVVQGQRSQTIPSLADSELKFKSTPEYENSFKTYSGASHDPGFCGQQQASFGFGSELRYGDQISQLAPLPQYPNPKLGNELPLPSSYSHYETSFARRLIRSTIEEAYRLLVNPWSRPEDAKRLCTFAFCFINAPKMLNRFQEVMKRTAKDNLELWAVPLYHIGDAGLHYPRVGIDASSEPPPWWADRGSIGPQPAAPQPEIPVPQGIVDVLEFPGHDGEWFDSNDVAEYLRSKGLTLDASSVIVEINDGQEAIPQSFSVDTGSLEYGDPWSRTPIPLSQTSSVSFNGSFAGTSPLSDQIIVQSFGHPVLPESMIALPIVTSKYLDVERFVKGMYLEGNELCVCSRKG